MAYTLNETVAMDLKEWTEANSKTWLLHLVHQATRLSASVATKSKRKVVIIEKLFRIWIKVFGYAQKFLVGTGGEFKIIRIRDFYYNHDIRIKTTAAESLQSIGLVERHNAIIAGGVWKTKKDINCSLNIAFPRSLIAKNSLQSIHDISPNQLIFSKNPNNPSVLADYLSASENGTSSYIVTI